MMGVLGTGMQENIGWSRGFKEGNALLLAVINFGKRG